MKPDSRPISFTNPIPFLAPFASTWADEIALPASETAVAKPNDLWIKEISLSIVFGMPITAIFNLRRSISSEMALAPRNVPSRGPDLVPAQYNGRIEPGVGLPGILFQETFPIPHFGYWPEHS